MGAVRRNSTHCRIRQSEAAARARVCARARRARTARAALLGRGGLERCHPRAAMGGGRKARRAAAADFSRAAPRAAERAARRHGGARTASSQLQPAAGRGGWRPARARLRRRGLAAAAAAPSGSFQALFRVVAAPVSCDAQRTRNSRGGRLGLGTPSDPEPGPEMCHRWLT